MKSLIYLSLCLILVSACSSRKKDKEDLANKTANSSVSSSEALGKSIHTLIESSQTLSEAQKKELYQILELNKKTYDELTEKSFKHRGVLVEELLSGKATKRRIKILEKNIAEVEKAKLKNTFDTVKKVSDIVSKHADKGEYKKHLIELHREVR